MRASYEDQSGLRATSLDTALSAPRGGGRTSGKAPRVGGSSLQQKPTAGDQDAMPSGAPRSGSKAAARKASKQASGWFHVQGLGVVCRVEHIVHEAPVIPCGMWCPQHKMC